MAREGATARRRQRTSSGSLKAISEQRELSGQSPSPAAEPTASLFLQALASRRRESASLAAESYRAKRY